MAGYDMLVEEGGGKARRFGWPYYAQYTVWLERNGRIYQKKSKTTDVLVATITATINLIK